MTPTPTTRETLLPAELELALRRVKTIAATWMQPGNVSFAAWSAACDLFEIAVEQAVRQCAAQETLTAERDTAVSEAAMLRKNVIASGEEHDACERARAAAIQRAETAEAALAKYADAIHPKRAESKDPAFWTHANIAILASAHRDDSLSVDDTRYESGQRVGDSVDWDFEKAAHARYAELTALRAQHAALVEIVTKAIDDEEELDGPIPVEAAAQLLADPESFLRATVRATKNGIKRRLLARLRDGGTQETR